MRTATSLVAAVWFLAAAVMIGDGSFARVGDPPNTEVLGDPVVMAIHLVARILFFGLGVLALGQVDWTAVRDFAGIRAPRRDEDGDSGARDAAN